MPRPTVRLNLEPLNRFAGAIRADLRGSGQGPVRQALRQWAARWRGFARARFERNSKGGGDWPPLAPSTIRRRRRGAGGGRRDRQREAVQQRRGGLAAAGVAILRDTSTLYGALDPRTDGKPGQLTQDIPFGVRVGFGGPARHPRGNATIADIAMFHDRGLGNNPQRQIIVDPDQQTVGQMAGDMQRAIDQMKRT